MTEALSSSSANKPKMAFGKILFLLPLIVFAGIIVALAWGLTRDPSVLPSTLIDKPVPEFELTPVLGRDLGLSNENLVGEVSIVNVFASWCIPCRAEHPLLMEVAARKIVTLHGINYKDQPEEAAAWLDELGDPYTRTGADLNGRVGIAWGVYGVPETFIISKEGRVVYKHVGPITPDAMNNILLPIVRRLNAPETKTGQSP